jgi:hypothetical protein
LPTIPYGIEKLCRKHFERFQKDQKLTDRLPGSRSVSI